MDKQIAIFRALYLGDMLCIVPAVRAIRTAFRSSRISLVGLPWQKDFVKRFPRYFDEFIPFPGWPGLPEQEPDLSAVAAFLQDMRKHNFDLLLQMQGNGSITNDMCMRWGAKEVRGLRRATDSASHTETFPVSEDGEHEVLRFLKLVDSLGIKRRGSHLEFPITEEEHTRAGEILAKTGLPEGGYVCIHPGARDERRRWPVENFSHIAECIASRGFPVVLTGSGEERELLLNLQKRIPLPVVNIVESFGHLGAGELAAVLQRSQLLVCNDTGVSHIATALSIPSVVIFSAYSEYNRWRPLNEKKHIAIPYEQARDKIHVLQCIETYLDSLCCNAPRATTAKIT